MLTIRQSFVKHEVEFIVIIILHTQLTSKEILGE